MEDKLLLSRPAEGIKLDLNPVNIINHISLFWSDPVMSQWLMVSVLCYRLHCCGGKASSANIRSYDYTSVRLIYFEGLDQM